MNVDLIMNDLVKKNPGEVEFHQAVKEVLDSLEPDRDRSHPRELLEASRRDQKDERENLEVVARAETVQTVTAGTEVGDQDRSHDCDEDPVGPSLAA